MGTMFLDLPDESFSGSDFGTDDVDAMMPMDLGPAHVSLAGLLLAALLAKFVSEADFLSLDVAEVRVSLVNTVNVGMQAVIFILLLKLAAAGLLRRGIVVPGLNDMVGAI